ncbi:MAG: hypothetical protein ACYSW3_00200 [Planctomycetota bacterium]|jgi:hypothetical protein
MITETLYKNRDNEIDLELRANGAAVDISGSTKVEIEVGDLVLNSNNYPTSFDWTTNGANGQLTLDIARLAEIVNLKASTYKTKVTVFDATYPNGLVWDHFILNLRE